MTVFNLNTICLFKNAHLDNKKIAVFFKYYGAIREEMRKYLSLFNDVTNEKKICLVKSSRRETQVENSPKNPQTRGTSRNSQIGAAIPTINKKASPAKTRP